MTVRVGQAVDVVAQAGKPKTITGFQTHTTPVLLAYGERAELANEECEFMVHGIFQDLHILLRSILISEDFHANYFSFFSDISMTPYLEGLVILKRNPDYDAPVAAKK